MGGCSVSRVGKDVDALLKEMEEQVKQGMERGLYPDSRLILLNPSTGETRTFKIIIDYVSKYQIPTFKEFKESKKAQYGDGIAIETAAAFGKKPKSPDEFVAMMHLHT